MFKKICILLVFVASVNCQTWASRACLENKNDYFVKIIQETINKIENDIKWCNFKLLDINKEINERLFKWHALGTANYTNGFLINLTKIDISNIDARFQTTTVNGTMEHRLTVSGKLNFRNLNLGYDVTAYMEDSEIHHFTGTFPYTTVAIQCSIVKNLMTNETSVSMRTDSSTAASRRMVYMPENSISEVLSRHIFNYDISPSFDRWGPDIMAPIVAEIASRAEIPKIRFDNKC
ncbi:unnamed protein product [Euphydryas editha]|uniref:Uncharacterized protein n=1 Tax=Euphydryas editha TaxID=104508 RepID=A0AAU9V7P0_EUPED|nr:unnamed protein product [Euphydryas editha]